MSKNEVLLMLLKARQLHLEWRSHAEMLIKGMELNDAKAPVEDHRCEFGKWFYGPAKECLGLLRYYDLVAESHHVMHAVYGEVYDHMRHQTVTEAKGKLLELARASDTLLDAIDLFEQEVLAAPECRH